MVSIYEIQIWAQGCQLDLLSSRDSPEIQANHTSYHSSYFSCVRRSVYTHLIID